MSAFVHFHYVGPSFHFPKRKAVKQFLLDLARQEGHALERLDYIFCDDEYLLSINRQFLQHDYYTDIITFPYAAKGMPLSGDIYISIDRVRENAASLVIPFQKELLRVLVHGLLHLCGYRDKTKAEIIRMRAREDQALLDFENI